VYVIKHCEAGRPTTWKILKPIPRQHLTSETSHCQSATHRRCSRCVLGRVFTRMLQRRVENRRSARGVGSTNLPDSQPGWCKGLQTPCQHSRRNSPGVCGHPGRGRKLSILGCCSLHWRSRPGRRHRDRSLPRDRWQSRMLTGRFEAGASRTRRWRSRRRWCTHPQRSQGCKMPHQI
jgi:hypothetical protein